MSWFVLWVAWVLLIVLLGIIKVALVARRYGWEAVLDWRLALVGRRRTPHRQR